MTEKRIQTDRRRQTDTHTNINRQTQTDREGPKKTHGTEVVLLVLLIATVGVVVTHVAQRDALEVVVAPDLLPGAYQVCRARFMGV